MLRLQRFSFRFAEQVLNSKLALKQEIENILTDPNTNVSTLSRPKFNEILEEKFVAKGWLSQPPVFDEPKDPAAKMDFLKERIGVEIVSGTRHSLELTFSSFRSRLTQVLTKLMWASMLSRRIISRTE